MKLSMLLPPSYDERIWTLARQAGVTRAVTKANPLLSGKKDPSNFEALASIKAEFDAAGFRLYGLEGDQFDMAPIKLGQPGRDQAIDMFCQMLRNMARLEIPLLCYNFMALIGWFRTSVDIQERGGALVSEFNRDAVPEDSEPGSDHISEGVLWNNLFYFLDAVLPVAEECGIQMALHPDDPPVSPLRSVPRILTSVGAFNTILEKYPSPANGITFCQATFKLMGADLKSVSEKWLRDKRIFFLHFRDVVGRKEHFREAFHDNGSTDMADMLLHYSSNGFDGPIRPDHAPAMFGESQTHFSGGIGTGYGITGRIFAVGYIKGICSAHHIPVD